MKSMTGYGRGSVSSTNLELVVEITSVNRRNLEVQISTPKEWTGLDRILTEQVRKVAGRGKVYLQLKTESYDDEDPVRSWDRARISSALEALRELTIEEEVAFKVDAALILEVAKLVSSEGESSKWEDHEAAILEAAQEALEHWEKMRSAEGAELKRDLLERTGLLESYVTQIREHSGNTVAEYRERLMERLRQSGLDFDVEDERVLKEIALFADRCDLSEELTRLDSHLAMLRSSLESGDLVGRKLDFICQEIYRELNTVGSKANNLEISRLVIESKNEWERLREQAANVE